jgi:hypothetical protein
MFESIYPFAGTRERSELLGATRWAYDIFVGTAPMPGIFFELETGRLLLPEQYLHLEDNLPLQQNLQMWGPPSGGGGW